MPDAARTSFADLLRRRLVSKTDFGAFPARFEPLATREAVERLGRVESRDVPPTASLDDILLTITSKWREYGTLEELSGSELRKAAWVLFYPADEPSKWLGADADWASAYLAWLSRVQRSSSIAASLRSFLFVYPHDIATFDTWRTSLHELLDKTERRALRLWFDRSERYGLLDVEGPHTLADHWFESIRGERADAQFLSDAGLTGGLETGVFVRRALLELLRVVRDVLEEKQSPGYLDTLFQELLASNGKLRFRDLVAETASTLLMPYQHQDPVADVRDKIRRFLVEHIGDPRIEREKWYVVGDDAKSVLTRWLIQLNLDAFFRILDRTAVDRHWRFRREFWTDYLERGLIREAWVVLGEEAQRIAYSHTHGEEFYFGRLRKAAGVDANHSVLLMKIGGMVGGITVAEWSHNGSCRFWLDGNDDAPEFYQLHYTGSDLRHGADHRIPHYAPERGSWQAKAHNWISSQVQVR